MEGKGIAAKRQQGPRAPPKGMGRAQKWDTEQKVWKSQAKPAGPVGLYFKGADFIGLFMGPWWGGSYQGPPELFHYQHVIQFLFAPFSILIHSTPALRTTTSFPRLSPV